MIKVILGKKINQLQRFNEQKHRLPVTFIEAGPCAIVDVKTKEKDGYWAVQLGFGGKKKGNIKKPQLGHLKKAGVKTPPRFLKEAKVSRDEAESLKLKVGKTIQVDEVFKVGDKIAVTGISKGKGFAGVMKRWKFAGGPATHGQSDRARAPGSIGGTTTPGRVYKGKKMAGRMGGKQVTVKGLKVVEIDSKENLLVVSGLVPGPKGGLLTIKL